VLPPAAAVRTTQRAARPCRTYRGLYIVNWIYRYFTEPHYKQWLGERPRADQAARDRCGRRHAPAWLPRLHPPPPPNKGMTRNALPACSVAGRDRADVAVPRFLLLLHQELEEQREAGVAIIAAALFSTLFSCGVSAPGNWGARSSTWVAGSPHGGWAQGRAAAARRVRVQWVDCRQHDGAPGQDVVWQAPSVAGSMAQRSRCFFFALHAPPPPTFPSGLCPAWHPLFLCWRMHAAGAPGTTPGHVMWPGPHAMGCECSHCWLSMLSCSSCALVVVLAIACSGEGTNKGRRGKQQPSAL